MKVIRITTRNGRKAEEFEMIPYPCNLPLEDVTRLDIKPKWYLDVPVEDIEEAFFEVEPTGEVFPHGLKYHGEWFEHYLSPRSYLFDSTFFLIDARSGIWRECSQLDARLFLRAIYSPI